MGGDPPGQDQNNAGRAFRKERAANKRFTAFRAAIQSHVVRIANESPELRRKHLCHGGKPSANSAGLAGSAHPWFAFFQVGFWVDKGKVETMACGKEMTLSLCRADSFN